MSPVQVTGNMSGGAFSLIDLQGFDTSWAGAYLNNDGFCFGAEDGRIRVTDSHGRTQLETKDPATRSGEAINGVAFLPGWMAVSTRNEVGLLNIPPTTLAETPYGAHGVIAGSGGYFFAPLGLTGFAFFRPSEADQQLFLISGGTEKKAYCYRVISLTAPDGSELLAFANRRDGVGTTTFRAEGSGHKLRTLTFAGLDVVDVCPLNPGAISTAIAALGRDGTLILFADALHDRRPGAVVFPDIEGTAYRILSQRGHLFLFTSKGMFIIADLARRFLQGDKDEPAWVMEFPMEVVDANLVGDRWLLVVGTDGVLKLDLTMLDVAAHRPASNGKMRKVSANRLSPAWQEQEIEQASTPAALALRSSPGIRL
jgi:hypothetical protein